MYDLLVNCFKSLPSPCVHSAQNWNGKGDNHGMEKWMLNCLNGKNTSHLRPQRFLLKFNGFYCDIESLHFWKKDSLQTSMIVFIVPRSVNFSRPGSHWCKTWRMCWSEEREEHGWKFLELFHHLNFTEFHWKSEFHWIQWRFSSTQKRTTVRVMFKAVPVTVTVAWGAQIPVCHQLLFPHCIC